jgi:hypothetical protein
MLSYDYLELMKARGPRLDALKGAPVFRVRSGMITDSRRLN